MMMTMMRGLDGPGGAVRGSRLHVGLQLGKGALRAGQVAVAEGFAKSGEIVLDRVVGLTRLLPIGGRATGLSTL